MLPAQKNKAEQILVEAMAEFHDDPIGWVMFCFDWGHGDLTGFDGPDTWQYGFLKDVGDWIKKNAFDGIHAVEPIREATSSGHGVGKSALVAFLILFIMSTRPHCKGIVTANTSAQLETKTWAELAKWKKRCRVGHWFNLSSGKMSMKIVHKDHAETWRCDAQTCREENSESFAGQHAVTSTPFYIFDEASAVPDAIWTVAEGGVTDGEPMWFVFGNPTRNTGSFRECFGRFRHRWHRHIVDSRTSKFTNKRQIEEWIQDYGEDSDFVRVRVKGEFPRVSSQQFISGDLVEAAMMMTRDPQVTLYDPLVMGVDVARFGDDQTVFRFRRGPDARTIPALKFRNLDSYQVTQRVAEAWEKHRPDAIFIDAGSYGAAVVDNCLQLRLPVFGIDFGSEAANAIGSQDSHTAYYNKRAEMWGSMRDWLPRGALGRDDDLISDLTGVEYAYKLKNGRDCLLLEKKEDMKHRGLPSPDDADALALTFAMPVAPRDHTGDLSKSGSSHQYEYDPLQQSAPQR